MGRRIKKKTKFLIVANIVMDIILFSLWGFYFTSQAKAAYDVMKVKESIKNHTVYEPVSNSGPVEKLYMKYLRNIYSRKTYALAANLMNEGYYDARPWYQTGDQEYAQWRYDTEPMYGDDVDSEKPGLTVIMEQGVKYDTYKYVLNCINTMPDEFIDRMTADGWTVIIQPGYEIKSDYSDEYENMVSIGQTIYEDKLVLLAEDGIEDTVYHEFGHVLAQYADDELDKAGLYDFGNEELATLCCHSADGSLYVYLTPVEQIAESFYDYILYPQEMQEQAPTLYGIFDAEAHKRG